MLNKTNEETNEAWSNYQECFNSLSAIQQAHFSYNIACDTVRSIKTAAGKLKEWEDCQNQQCFKLLSDYQKANVNYQIACYTDKSTESDAVKLKAWEACQAYFGKLNADQKQSILKHYKNLIQHEGLLNRALSLVFKTSFKTNDKFKLIYPILNHYPDVLRWDALHGTYYYSRS